MICSYTWDYWLTACLCSQHCNIRFRQRLKLQCRLNHRHFPLPPSGTIYKPSTVIIYKGIETAHIYVDPCVLLSCSPQESRGRVNSLHLGVHTYFRDRGVSEMYVMTLRARVCCDRHGGDYSNETANQFYVCFLYLSGLMGILSRLSNLFPCFAAV
jgi:hypothetical protein